VINQIPYTYQKRGVFYFNRMVPSDLGGHYQSRRINFSLRTKSVRSARQFSSAVSLKLESYWQHLLSRESFQKLRTMALKTWAKAVVGA
jgi:hypothetical protein